MSVLIPVRSTTGPGNPLIWKVEVTGDTLSVPVPVGSKRMEWSFDGRTWHEGAISLGEAVTADVWVAVFVPDTATVGASITLSASVGGVSFPDSTGTVVADLFDRSSRKPPKNTEAIRRAFFSDGDPIAVERALDWLQSGNSLGDLIQTVQEIVLNGAITGNLDPAMFSTVDGQTTLNMEPLLAQIAADALAGAIQVGDLVFAYGDDGDGNIIVKMVTMPSFVTDGEVTVDLSSVVAKVLYNANSILIANTDDTPEALTVPVSTVVGRKASGNIVALTPAEARTVLELGSAAVESTTAFEAAGTAVLKSLFDANTVLAATSDDTPTALLVGPSTFLGRKATGDISAMSVAEAIALLGFDSSSLVAKSLYNANTILYATTDDTPAALTVGASTVIGRKASGDIVALTADELRTILATAIPIPLTALTGFVDAAGQNRQAYRNQAGTFNVCSLKMPVAGKIIRVSVDQTAARSGGTATHTVYKNGSSTAITAVIDGTNTTHVVGTAGSVAFAAGDLLDTRQSVSSYTGTAAYEATIWVQFDAS